MNRLMLSNPLSLLMLVLLTLGSAAQLNGVAYAETAPVKQTKAKRPKPTFFEQTRKQEEQRKAKGFAPSFLSEALGGVADPLAGIGGSGTGLSNAEFQGESNSSFPPYPSDPTQVLSGSFTKTDSNTGSFSSASGVVSFGNFDLTSNPITLSQGGVTYPATNYGFSGDNAFATFVVNGQTTTYTINNVPRGRSIPIGQTFTGSSITTSISAPDR